MLWNVCMALLCTALLRTSSEQITELVEDDACSGGCGIELMQKKATKETKELSYEYQMWQGARETGTKCMWGCASSFGPTDCYHMRCVCKQTYIFDKETSTCISHDMAVEKGVISARDTGATCKWVSCKGEATTCDPETYKCMCIPAYSYKQDSCQFDPLQGIKSEQEQKTQSQDSPTTEASAQEWPDAWPDAAAPQAAASPAKVAAPSPAPPVVHAPVGGAAACSANPGCAKLGLQGDCCPAPSGVVLGCCG
eukprot:TRINITY_DN104547_c0_g1_i1.p1 TRINITY_DN104547_c0_g1~~TRINITY_DN104547_c0_g1_i1.p1  ORF type:complete len:253 (+),score=37.64 TRINITY_DN104547_c0_g1_i1:218-976(+)